MGALSGKDDSQQSMVKIGRPPNVSCVGGSLGTRRKDKPPLEARATPPRPRHPFFGSSRLTSLYPEPTDMQ
jgi:hypothetical protein